LNGLSGYLGVRVSPPQTGCTPGLLGNDPGGLQDGAAVARIRRLAVRAFRNLTDADLELPPPGLVLVGRNGHGKTSFLEALLYPEVFRSFRGGRDRELVRFGEAGFHVQVETDGSDEAGGEVAGRWAASGCEAGGKRARMVAAGYDVRTKEKRVVVGGLPAARLAEAIGIVRGVVLSPDDVQLVSGGARGRRQYLDVLLSLVVPGYVEALGEYRRALRHRCLAGADVADWEALLARSGAKVAAGRRAWAERWAARYREHCRAIGETAAAELCYASRGTTGAPELAEALERSREKDLARGHTSVGPHRDDLRLLLGGRELRVYGSAGQWRTAAMALRLVEAETLAEAGGGAGAFPVLCLDDAFAELDAARSAQLGALVEDLAARGSQVFATVPRDGEMPAAVSALPKWRIEDGTIEA
jgi:DNA replication and repair protein RecF